MVAPPAAPLPIDPLLPEVQRALGEHGAAVLVAATGAGKSTRVAPSLLPTCSGQVLLLQPRRVAARSLAERIAYECGEALGQSVGYQVRHEKRGGAATRLWLLTEGLLTRRLLSDPYLEGVSVVILDEFHERSVDVDIALAWLAELRRTLRPDLQLLVMSATIDPAPVAAYLDHAPVVASPGRSYPVHICYQAPPPRARRDEVVAAGIRRALEEGGAGDVLAFVPGVGEINGVMQQLADLAGSLAVLPLHGSLPSEQQDRALRPDPQGKRKVVVATNVAETSLTIDGLSAVVDSGLHRVQRFDPERGLPVLRLEQIARWNADQRAGRAGRTQAGWCLRLWSSLEDQRLAGHPAPAIAHSDLAPVALTLRLLHGNDMRSFPWLTPPEESQVSAAENLLHHLGLTSGPFTELTPRGRYVAGMPLHPRLSRLLLAAEEEGCLHLGAAVAALLSERAIRQRSAPPPGRAVSADVEDDLYLLAAGPRHPAVHPAAYEQIERSRRDLLHRWGQGDLAREAVPQGPGDVLPALLLAAYPDRVAKRSAPDSNRLQWADGAGELASHSVAALRPGLRGDPLVLAYAVRSHGGRGRQGTFVDGAAQCSEELLRRIHPEAFHDAIEHYWAPGKARVEAARVRRFAGLVLSYQAGQAVDPEQSSELLMAQLGTDLSQALAAYPAAAQWFQRWCWLAAQPGVDGLPDPHDPQWQAAFMHSWCQGARAVRDLPDPLPLMQGLWTWPQRQRLDEWAPESVSLPGGQQRRLAYGPPEQPPSLRLRIQQCFGWRQGPTVLAGRLRVRLELLAPNDRPQQITDDLAGFWAGSYAQVRKDLRGRYPKHPWPEDPATAEPVRPRGKGGRKGK